MHGPLFKIMSYTVIARKYRPQTFSELVGQKPIAETLSNAIKLNKISHAYLFTGPRGVGKTSTARILAKSINCKNGPTPKPCGVCKNCVEITEGNSLDVVEIDGASNRGIDEIRDLKEKVNFAPINSLYKVYIIDEVHMLTEAAFNALLKTLEEPPEHIVFIFATTEPHKIPKTVLSRCQRYDFRRISIEEIIKQLKMISNSEKVKIDYDALFLIAKSSDGSLRDAQSTLDQLIAFSSEKINEQMVRQLFGISEIEIYNDFLSAVILNDVKKGLTLISDIYRGGNDLKQFVLDLIEFVRNIFFVKIGIDDINILEESEEKIKIYKSLASKFENDVLEEIIEYLSKMLNEFRFTNQFKTLLEIGFLHLIDIYNKISLKFIYKYIKNIAEPEINKMKDENINQINFNWNEVISRFEKDEKFKGEMLKTGKLKMVDEKNITVILNNRTNYSTLDDKNVKKKLAGIIKSIYSLDVTIKFELENSKKSEDKNTHEQMIKKVQEIFDGTIVG